MSELSTEKRLKLHEFIGACDETKRRLDAMGVDGMKAIENLLLLIAQAKRGPTTPCTEGSRADDKWLAENMRHFMQSIQRNDDE